MDVQDSRGLMSVDGICHCGEIAWEALIDPERLVLCHCTDCQVMGGGAFLWGVPVPIDRFTLLSGIPRSYRKQGSSGAWRRLHFCGTCSTPLYGTEDDNPSICSLRLGSCRQARQLREALVAQGLALDTLSMGMSADMAPAIAEGSTMVRVGTAIFGKR